MDNLHDYDPWIHDVLGDKWAEASTAGHKHRLLEDETNDDSSTKRACLQTDDGKDKQIKDISSRFSAFINKQEAMNTKLQQSLLQITELLTPKIAEKMESKYNRKWQIESLLVF